MITQPDKVPQLMFGTPVADWHQWYAWYPVRTFDGRIAWLRKVHRRLIQKHTYLPGGGPDHWWQYSP